mmetsp:Transcript_38015/g.93239  ORF Transcript_38015/g.93239 Transcript_38015/m.93239 type:complete len:93 (-) Transcript_38015:170-448(-)
MIVLDRSSGSNTRSPSRCTYKLSFNLYYCLEPTAIDGLIATTKPPQRHHHQTDHKHTTVEPNQKILRELSLVAPIQYHQHCCRRPQQWQWKL